MSYSVSARGLNKVAALAALAANFDATVLPNQPVHEHDKAAALAAAEAFANLLPDDDGKDVNIALSGYLSWQAGTDATGHVFSAASVSVSASLVARQPESGGPAAA